MECAAFLGFQVECGFAVASVAILLEQLSAILDFQKVFLEQLVNILESRTFIRRFR